MIRKECHSKLALLWFLQCSTDHKVVQGKRVRCGFFSAPQTTKWFKARESAVVFSVQHRPQSLVIQGNKVQKGLMPLLLLLLLLLLKPPWWPSGWEHSSGGVQQLNSIRTTYGSKSNSGHSLWFLHRDVNCCLLVS